MKLETFATATGIGGMLDAPPLQTLAARQPAPMPPPIKIGLPPACAAEAALVARLRAGDETALEAIFHRYAPRLLRVAEKIVGDTLDAEEVIQDVFWTAFRKADGFIGNARFSTWLYRLTVNAALGKTRRCKRSREVSYEECMPQFIDDRHPLHSSIPDGSQSLETGVARQEIRERIAQALDRLKPLDRSVVVLSDIDGLADREIAQTVGLSLAAVKTRLHRARQTLRQVLTAKECH